MANRFATRASQATGNAFPSPNAANALIVIDGTVIGTLAAQLDAARTLPTGRLA